MVSFMFKISFMIFCLKILYLSTYIVHTLCSGMSYIMLDDVGTFKRVPLSTTVQACRSRGCHSIPRFWQIQLTLFQPGGGRLIAQHITTRPLRIFRPSYGPAVHHHHFMHSVEPSCSAESAQCQVNIWKGSFFFTIFTAAPWLWLLALFFVVGCPGEDTGYIFHLFFIGPKPAKLLKSNMVGNIKHFQIDTFSWSHIADPRIKQRY